MIDGKKLKKIRKLKLFRQCELAQKAGGSQSLLSRLERNEVKYPRFSSLEKIANVLNDKSFLWAKNEEQHQKQTSIEKAKFLSNDLSKFTAKLVDDRVCMHYVVDRLEELVALSDPDRESVDFIKVHKRLCDFKEELVYNLGVNTRIKHKGED